jgi:hypothetical protein
MPRTRSSTSPSGEPALDRGPARAAVERLRSPQANLFFQVVAKRYEKGAMILT